VTIEAGAGQLKHEEPLLQPTANWPRNMTADRWHLVTIDLALVKQDGTPAQWPLRDEEYAYTCLLDGGGVFDLWAVHDATVVLHRFGGSYGAAKFVVIPRLAESGTRSLWLTIINQGGVAVNEYELPVDVHVPHGDQVTIEDPIDQKDPILMPARFPNDDVPGDRSGVEPGSSVPPAGTVIDDARPTEAYAQETADIIGGPRHDDTAPDTKPAVPRRRGGPPRIGRLPESYSVAGLRRSRSGSLQLDTIELFPPGAATGARRAFTARCVPSDERGTVFAVLAEPETRSNQLPELRSMQSAKVPPGMYQVTAELLYPNPGHVQFHGLPAAPSEDLRPWQEIVSTVPGRLPVDGGPVHLIAAIEVSGPDDRTVRERLDSVRRLVRHVAAEARNCVCYSVMTYGPHSINPNNPEFPEVPVATLTWANTAGDALEALDLIGRRGPAPFGYKGAAQLECMLTDLDGNLTGEEGRPVVITVGARPPHPPRVDPATKIIPCPHRRDWTVPLTRLKTRHAGIAFGSIRDAAPPDELWRVLGANATTLDDDFDSRFARRLALTSASALPIALPLLSG
jgi:hypothetical protein